MSADYGDTRLPSRFWEKVTPPDTPDGCWLWTAAVNHRGYGKFRADPPVTTRKAHRIAYMALVDDRLELDLDHLCRNKRCVNPAHLEPVLSTENHRRTRGKRPLATHCAQGHAFTRANTILDKQKSGTTHRKCRICVNRLMRIRYHRGTAFKRRAK